MTPQTEALRLPDEWLRKTRSEADRRNSAYDHYGMGNTPENVDPLGAKMAAELRRQHGEIKSMRAERLRSERRLLDVKAQRNALLEALKEVLAWGTDQNYVRAKAACDKARAAIKKAQGDD